MRSLGRCEVSCRDQPSQLSLCGRFARRSFRIRSQLTAKYNMPEAKGHRYRMLDCWRGIACLVVVVFHSTFYLATPELVAHVRGGDASWAELGILLTTRLWYGVPIFFVISGYCIAASADSHVRRGHTVRRYFLRRFRRIFPPLWCFLMLGVLLVGGAELLWPGLFADNVYGIDRPWWLSASQWVGNLTLTESWRHHILGDDLRYLFGHLWTLCYEEQFYAVVGIILLAAPRYFFTGIVLITAAVAVLFAIGPTESAATHGFFFDGLWLQFAAGTGLYAVIHKGSRSKTAIYVVLLLAGIIGQACLLPTIWATDHNPVESNIVAFAFALLLLAMHRHDASLHKLRLVRPFEACGLACYSIYLVHLPIVKGISHALFLAGVSSAEGTLLLTVPVCLAVSVIAGRAFHTRIERHFLNAPLPKDAQTPTESPTLAPAPA